MILSGGIHRLLMFALFMLHLSFAAQIDRENTFAVILTFFGLWSVFLVQWADQKMSVRKIFIVGMALRCIYLFSFPELSDDFWRYLWDGMLISGGHSPYTLLPVDWNTVLPASYGDVFPFLNSPEYYSIYPPVLQFFFGLSEGLSDGSPLTFVMALRSCMLLAEFGSMVLIWKLLKAWEMNTRNLMLYALNPLVIVEFIGNLHGEVFMVFFVLLSLWFLTPSPLRGTPPLQSLSRFFFGKESWRVDLNFDRSGGRPEWFRRELLSAIAFGLSIATKLLPLMFLPFYIKRLGWKRTILFGTAAMATVVLFYLPFWSVELIPNVLSSARLYFANFEFNASMYYVARQIGVLLTGYNQIAIIGRLLSLVILALILLIAWKNENRKLSGLPELMLFAWFIFYAFATTVNPWYVAVLAAFLPFTTYRFGLLWMITVPLSYHAFGNADYHENMWVIALEYVPVYLWLLFELKMFAPIQRKWAVRKAEVKRKRLLPFLKDMERDSSLRSTRAEERLQLLEVGAGNGALTMLLEQENINVSALDIRNKSLFKEVNVAVYDGAKFPYRDKQFDVCQLITMLHHTENAEELICGAARVSDRVIIMEDIYEGTWQQYLTWFADSVVNWEFYGHPHTNRTDAEWKELFEKNGLVLEKTEHYQFLFFFKQVTYVLRH